MDPNRHGNKRGRKKVISPYLQRRKRSIQEAASDRAALSRRGSADRLEPGDEGDRGWPGAGGAIERAAGLPPGADRQRPPPTD
jgi:hypothetical protein